MKFSHLNTKQPTIVGSVNRTVSSYFLPYSPQQETMHGFLLSFFLLAKLHDFISITKFDGQLL